MVSQIVIVKKDRHANLDSFPFRYGFSETDDFELIIEYNSKPFVQNHGSQQRLKIDKAKFKNPITDDIEEGDFVLEREAQDEYYSVVTVIRTDKNIDKTLSQALKLFRKHKYVTVDDLINYFHPLYLKGKIKTHHDLKNYLIKLNSNNEENVNKIELVLKSAYKEIEKLEFEKNESKFKFYEDYANSNEYKRDRAVADGWVGIYDEAIEYSNAAFNEYLQEYNEQIQKVKSEVGERVLFFSWTSIEENMREIYPKAAEGEIQNIMEGWRIHEKIINQGLVHKIYSKNKSKKNEKKSKGKKLIIELSEDEIKVYDHWQKTIGTQLEYRTTTKLEKNKKS